jgi:transposase
MRLAVHLDLGGRFVQARLGGLFAHHGGRAPTRDPAKLEARVLERTLKHKPRDGSTHWSSRKLAAELKLLFMTVQRIWRKHSVQPHRVERHMISNDPDFETRRRPRAPAGSGTDRSKSATGEVLGMTAPRHTSAQVVAFLADVVASQPEGKAIHVICDNVSAHKTDAVDDCLAGHANVRIHYTPTYSSWLNQVENWFSRIQRDVITRGVFTNVKDLDKRLMRYTRQQQESKTHQVEVRQPEQADQVQFIRFTGLVWLGCPPYPAEYRAQLRFRWLRTLTTPGRPRSALPQ